MGRQAGGRYLSHPSRQAEQDRRAAVQLFRLPRRAGEGGGAVQPPTARPRRVRRVRIGIRRDLRRMQASRPPRPAPPQDGGSWRTADCSGGQGGISPPGGSRSRPTISTSTGRRRGAGGAGCALGICGACPCTSCAKLPSAALAGRYGIDQAGIGRHVRAIRRTLNDIDVMPAPGPWHGSRWRSSRGSRRTASRRPRHRPPARENRILRRQRTQRLGAWAGALRGVGHAAHGRRISRLCANADTRALRGIRHAAHAPQVRHGGGHG